jgi:hypothetical protein
MSDFPLVDRLRLTAGSIPQRLEKLRRKGPFFLKGPVPLDWLQRAARLPGRSLTVGLIVWFLAGLQKRPTVRVAAQWRDAFGVDRHALYRALKWLESDGLVTVDRRVGSCPVVTLPGWELHEGVRPGKWSATTAPGE